MINYLLAVPLTHTVKVIVFIVIQLLPALMVRSRAGASTLSRIVLVGEAGWGEIELAINTRESSCLWAN